MLRLTASRRHKSVQPFCLLIGLPWGAGPWVPADRLGFLFLPGRFLNAEFRSSGCPWLLGCGNALWGWPSFVLAHVTLIYRLHLFFVPRGVGVPFFGR